MQRKESTSTHYAALSLLPPSVTHVFRLSTRGRKKHVHVHNVNTNVHTTDVTTKRILLSHKGKQRSNKDPLQKRDPLVLLKIKIGTRSDVSFIFFFLLGFVVFFISASENPLFKRVLPRSASFFRPPRRKEARETNKNWLGFQSVPCLFPCVPVQLIQLILQVFYYDSVDFRFY